MRLTSGAVYVFDWGDGQQTWHTGNGASQAITHTYASAGTYEIKLYVHDPATLLSVVCFSNSLTGSLPDFTDYTALATFNTYGNSLTGSIPDLSVSPLLTTFLCNGNSLTGSIPDLSSNIALSLFYCYSNSLTGSIPDLSANTSLSEFYCNANNLSGSIPSLSANAVLTRFYCYNNSSLAGYTASTLSATIAAFRAEGCALTQAAVDQVLADFLTNAAARPAAGTINLSGGTNSAPSAQGIADRLAFLAIQPGWTISVNS